MNGKKNMITSEEAAAIREKFKHVKDPEIRKIMSRKGNCLDNAVIENFWGTLKSEWFYLNKFSSVEIFLEQLEHYIYYFNYERDSGVLLIIGHLLKFVMKNW